MPIKQTPLPYELNALEPHISAETMGYHYDRHHRSYVNKLNDLVKDSPFAAMDLEAIIEEARSRARMDILNNALQAWNHTFLWQSMSPASDGKPEGRILKRIEDEFGDVATFLSEFREKALGHFGSGWVWLVEDRGQLRIVTTSNADSPIGTSLTPLLVLDVWEHAYYIDYRNERKRYVDAFLNNLINWKFAAANLEACEESSKTSATKAA